LDQLHHERLQDGTGAVLLRGQYPDKANHPVNGVAPQSKAAPASKPATSANAMPVNALKTPRPAAPTKDTAPQAKATPMNNATSPVNPTPTNTHKPARRPANRKPSASAPPKTHTTRSKKGANVSPPVAKSASSKPSRLMQGPGSVSSYYTATEKAHSKLPNMNSQGEIEFVSAFIAGLSSEKHKNALIAEMEQLHPFRTKKDGKIQLLCQWEDVEEGLVNAGLIPEKGKEVDGPSTKKRKTLGDVDFVRG
jgi:hypothetical protein